MTTALAQAIGVLISTSPDSEWITGDDLCDCTFQQVREWTNPYLGQTLRIRWCCILAELEKQYPQYFSRVDAFYDHNRDEYIGEPQPWDSTEMDMPVPLWYRQLARQQGRPLAEVRAEYSDRKTERPKKVKHSQRKAPTVAEVKRARHNELKRTGWIL